jgi:hypothetical protein
VADQTIMNSRQNFTQISIGQGAATCHHGWLMEPELDTDPFATTPRLFVS